LNDSLTTQAWTPQVSSYVSRRCTSQEAALQSHLGRGRAGHLEHGVAVSNHETERRGHWNSNRVKAQFLHNLLQNSASDAPSLGPSASGYAKQLASEGIPDVATWTSSSLPTVFLTSL